MGGETLQAWLRRAAAGPERGIRLVDRDEREELLSWPEVEQRAARVAAGLRDLGIDPGDRVALVYPTGADFFAALFGVLLAGGVPVPLYPPVRLGRLPEYHERTAGALAAVGTTAVLADAGVRRLLGESVARARPPLGCRTLAELPAPSGQPPFHAGAPEELALIQFSSGTTAEPKPVALTQRAVTAQVLALNTLWPDRPDRRHAGCSWLPLYHDMGLIGCVLPALERGADLTLLRPEQFLARPALWLRAISRARATISPAPNFAYAYCTERIRDEELAGVDLSCWCHALCGAETVVPETLRRFEARFAPHGLRPEVLTPVYGLSEAALAVTFAPLARPWRSATFDRAALAERGVAAEEPGGIELASVGRPLERFELSLRDDRGQEVGAGRRGRVWVRGPSLMAGYFGRPEATAAVLEDGWLDTGDLGFLHGGELFLAGRAKDLLLVRGRSHAPGEVEEAVAGLAGLRPGGVAAVSHLPEGAATERVLLFAERRDGTAEEAVAALPGSCRAAVAAATGLVLDEVVVLAPGSLPRTSSGKVRRQEALRRHLAGELTAPSPVTPLRLAAALVRSKLALVRGRRGAKRGQGEA
jgi:acyl-CoA synthetase (AMP-forming)/AMP-acid ligase II